MKRTSLAIFAALICASAPFVFGSALAQQASASSGALDKFVGSGTCSGKSLDSNMKSFHDTTGKFSGEKVLDGNWVQIRYDEDKSAVVPKPYHVLQYIGYDATKKHYVAVTVDSSDSGYSTGTSAGWKGDSITFDESMNGKPASMRDTFTTSSSGMSSHTGTMRDKSGKWVKTDEETCNKA